MKVLRTALFSTFLMLCFMNVGHAQFGTQTTFNLPMTISNMSMTPIGNGQALIEYNVSAPANSLTTIKYGLTPLHTEVVSGFTQVSAIVTIDVKGDSDDVYLKCGICNEDGSECREDGCVVTIDGEGGGGE